MTNAARLLIFAIAFTLVGTAARSQTDRACRECLDPKAYLRDSQGAVRGSVEIVGSGEQATILVRDANGVVLLAPFGSARTQLAPLVLEPNPKGNKSTDADIDNLKRQVSILQQNVRALQDRVNALR